MTFNGIDGSEQKYYEETTKSIRDYEKKIRDSLDYPEGYKDFYQDYLLKNRIDLENNLESQHGVTPWKLDSALQNGLSALGYASPWALPADCVHWGYSQEPLIVCNEASNYYNLYCKESQKIVKNNETSLFNGANDIYKNLEAACKTVLSAPNLPLNYQLERGFPLQDYLLTEGASNLTRGPSDFSLWEKNCPTLGSSRNWKGLEKRTIDDIPNSYSLKDEKIRSSEPLDFSIKNKSSIRSESKIERAGGKVRKEEVHTSRYSPYDLKRDFPKEGGAREGSSSSTRKLDVDRVKDEKNSGGNASYWQDNEMSGQYPGHSRPPVGTPPPQNVWNHLTMTQAQKNISSNSGNRASSAGPGSVPTSHESLQRSYERVQSDLTYLLSEVSGLNMHPSGLSGASLNPAGFYTHASMARAASHLTSQLTPQLAHTQAPPTWHTPTVPSKSVAAPNAPGNPLYSLQMLVDNRQNQNQYRNSPGSQSTLDLSATSEMAENYSRMTQDIPISLTARNVEKGSRNGNIISPPIPLNGETSSDSGISSSVPTPNSLGEPVSLSTKDLSTPKITVKNFESNLKGVANLHDKIKDMSVDNFAQKVINLPPSVTIERVMTNTEKKDEQQPLKMKDTLSVIAQVPRNVLPVIVNLTSRMDKDDSPRESSSERKIDDSTSVRSPKNVAKRANKKGVDSLLEKLEGGNKKLGSAENIGSVIVTPLEERDNSSVKSMSPERQKSKSPTRDEDVVSPSFSNEDSNDQTKQRRKRKLEKPVRLSKDSKTEVEDMELEPTEPREPRITEEVINCRNSQEEVTHSPAPSVPPVEEERVEDRTKEPEREPENEEKSTTEEEKVSETTTVTTITTTVTTTTTSTAITTTTTKEEEDDSIKRRRSSEGPSCQTSTPNQRTRRKSSDGLELSKVTSPKGVSSVANPFHEVESELEKMFAGIVENEQTPEDDTTKTEVKETSELKSEQDPKMVEIEAKEEKIDINTELVIPETKASPAGKKGKKAKMRGGKRKMSKSRDSGQGMAIDDVGTPKEISKKRKGSKGAKKVETPTKRTKNKNFKVDGLREISYDSGSNASSIRSRGPVVHVEGPRDSPLSVQVVNAPREDEEEKSKEKRKSVGNGNMGRSKRLSHQNDLDYRGKVSRAGLFSSTLSSRYDAHTTDSSWVCVFCKQGPHSVIPGDPFRPHPNLAGPHIAPGTYTVPAGVLSDLFGPYVIGKERLEEGILSADEQEITTEQKKGGKNKHSLRYAGVADQFSAKMGKKKRNSVESVVPGTLTGITLLPGDEQRFEVWLHEQCALWAAGVYMAGGRVTGLQEAVWDSTKSICDSCGLAGANIGCVKRGCKSVTHYPCALTKGWLLDTNQYIPKCNLHRVT